MKRKPLPTLAQEPVRVSVDIREQNVEVPRLLELEHALEPRHPKRKQGSPKRSMARVDVFRAIKSAGEYCSTTVPALAQMAQVSPRECQYAISDLLWLGWIKKLADVAKLGGLAGRGAQKSGNLYTVTRPSWAWNGEHRKHLWSLVAQSGVGVHSMHPSLQELFGFKKPEELEPAMGVLKSNQGRGAQHAPLGRVHRAKTPLSLVLKGKKEEKGASKTGQRVEWPKDGLGFLEAWQPTYKRGPFPDQKALDAYHEIRVGAGGAKAAEDVAKAYVATKDAWLERKGHPLAWLRKHWPTVVLPKAPVLRKAVKAAGGDVLSRLSKKH